MEKIFCFLVKDDKNLIDDDSTISIFSPIRIGSSILICGKVNNDNNNNNNFICENLFNLFITIII
jgi:hypothetical protein